jgi:hypothetical protein
MMKKIVKEIMTLIVIGLMVIGTAAINAVPVNAAGTADKCDVTFTEITFSNGAYHVVSPIVTLPTGKTATYITINVANGYFNTSAVTDNGTHHYNYGGTSSYAFSDLLLLKSGYNTAASISNLLTKINFYYDASVNTKSDVDGIAVYFTLSTNTNNLPESFDFYQVPGEDHYYIHVVTGAIAWHDAYNKAKQNIFGGLRGYLATIASTDENAIMHNISGNQAWVGGTAIYVVPGESTSVSMSTWTKINDPVTIVDSPSGYSYATKNKYGSPSTLYSNYYWADGPESGSVVSSEIYDSSEPNAYPTVYKGTLKRATGDISTTTGTEDCLLTNWNGNGGLNDYSEAHLDWELDGYFVEFIAQDTYANGFVDSYTAWKNGNANSHLVASTKLHDRAYTNRNNVTFNQYLIMDQSATVPAKTFTYTISTTGGSSSTLSTSESLMVSGTPTVASASFASSSTTSTESPEDEAFQLNTNEKYAVKEVNVSFESVNFTEPGIYRYAVTETVENESYITYDTARTQYLDVYVYSNDENDDLVVQGFVLHKNADDAAVANGVLQVANKSEGFIDKYTTESLTVSKTISGNQARSDQYFLFNIEISNAISGTTYSIDLPTDKTTEAGKEYSTSLAVANGKATGKVWLKAGQSFTINGITKGISYSVGEDSDQLKQTGYASTLAKAEGDKLNGTAALVMNTSTLRVEDNAISDVTALTINNEKAGVIPTGVIIAVAPYVTIALGGFFGLLFFVKHKKSEEDDEEDL